MEHKTVGHVVQSKLSNRNLCLQPEVFYILSVATQWWVYLTLSVSKQLNMGIREYLEGSLNLKSYTPYPTVIMWEVIIVQG